MRKSEINPHKGYKIESANSRNYRIAYRRYSCVTLAGHDRRLPIIPLNWQSDRVQVRPAGCVGGSVQRNEREIVK